MKLDNLTPTELACYEDWNGSDHMGGDCDTQGYAWAAWDGGMHEDEPPIMIIEDEYGFVTARTFTADESEEYWQLVAQYKHDDETAAEWGAMAWNYPG